MKSVLFGNGLDIQLGGNDYLNKWIIVRMLAKAKIGKYDKLFNSIITGNEIENLFIDIITVANKILNDEYDELIENYADKELSIYISNAIKDFKKNHCDLIKSIEQVGMEDIILFFQLFLIEEADLFDLYKSVKFGYCQMLLDAIYCEGKIQTLEIPKTARAFFEGFDNIFTLNYDNCIEKTIRKKEVYHLHGDYKTPLHLYNYNNCIGYYNYKIKRIQKPPVELKHSFSNAILDFSGEIKYNSATLLTRQFNEFEKLKKQIYSKELSYSDFINKIPDDKKEYFSIGIDKDLSIGENYHFDKFENLSGELYIIGLAPTNDRHIFECINKSNIDNVIFYAYFSDKTSYESEKDNIKLNITKPYIIRNVNDLWDDLGINMPKPTTFTISDEQVSLVNTLSFDTSITKEELLKQINSIPKTTRNILIDLLDYELKDPKYHNNNNIKTKEFIDNFKNISKVLKISSLSPQSLLILYFILKNKELK